MERRRAAARAHAQEPAREIGEGGSTRAWIISQQSPWNVDWVELSDQPESMVTAIVESGVVLSERC